MSGWWCGLGIRRREGVCIAGSLGEGVPGTAVAERKGVEHWRRMGNVRMGFGLGLRGPNMEEGLGIWLQRRELRIGEDCGRERIQAPQRSWRLCWWCRMRWRPRGRCC